MKSKRPTERLRIDYLPISKLLRAPRNPKLHDLGALHESLNRNGYIAPIILNDATGKIVAGHGRLDALQQLKASGAPAPDRVQVSGKEWLVPVVRGVSFPSEADAEAYVIGDNQITMLGGWNEAMLASLLSDLAAQDSLAGTGFDLDALDELLRNLGAEPGENGAGLGSLADRFGVPPFSVLNAREGWWQDRKRAWLALGIQSELGRGGGVNSQSRMALELAGGFANHPAHKTMNLSPGGSPRPAMKVKGGKTERGDGRGRPLA